MTALVNLLPLAPWAHRIPSVRVGVGWAPGRVSRRADCRCPLARRLLHSGRGLRKVPVRHASTAPRYNRLLNTVFIQPHIANTTNIMRRIFIINLV